MGQINSESRLIALLHGPDAPGLVARTSSWIFERGGNIIHADQHRDGHSGVFFQRLEWVPPQGELESQAKTFPELAKELGMTVSVKKTNRKPRVLLRVSKIPHCFIDFLLRYEAGELPCEIVGILSNHPDFESEARQRGIPFKHIPVTSATKAKDEAAQLEWIAPLQVDLVVMARYMQILSETFLDKVGCPVINIHHSFLPAFAGAKPYHQAHSRGVKLIGATAHYATEVLDDGPIIHQAVEPVSHRHSVEDLIRLGRDIERKVLSQAVRWHLQHRVLCYDKKTVIFD
ncbi:MAG: formyltetrahydrofolate deformylase [Chroococcales cyanobacterium]